MRIHKIRSAVWASGLTCVALALASCVPIGLRSLTSCDGPCAKRKCCDNATMMALARDIDGLDKHIDWYGSVVAKQPDVWGQARLTQHREQFEQEMYKQFAKFEPSLQGSLARTDQAYLASAFALSAAVSGRQAGAFAPRPRVVVNNSTAQGVKTEAPAKVLEPTPIKDLPAQADPFQVFADDNITRTALRPGMAPTFKEKVLSLEPTVLLDQKARYLNHLNQIRRINEGDDTVDSPGYALNLIRIPVSVFPGKLTKTGFGAEVTMTLEPHLGDELLPTTFRNLVINDLVDQLGLPLTQYINGTYLPPTIAKKVASDKPLTEKEAARTQRTLMTMGISNIKLKPNEAVDDASVKAAIAAAATPQQPPRPTVPVTKLRRARLPFPPSQMLDIYGSDLAKQVVDEAYETFERDPASNYPCEDKLYVHLPDVQSFLQEELAAAHKFLAHPSNHDLWSFCSPELVHAVRSRQASTLLTMRTNFLTQAEQLAGLPAIRPMTLALAWAVIVESALLNDQLIRDMKETASNKGCGCAPTQPLPYYHPHPPAEARQAFNEYVRCRWPIHVFALDPATQQQNIADTFSARREMQLAMSLAFVSGQISARQMTRYARRIEFDLETIDLNNTAVGFSHGNETFGWRFYPRFQTPDIESNLTVLARDLLLGGPGRSALIRQRRLEPGMRECVAVVIMPSFVPYATMHVSSNWFSLTHPKCKELGAADAMKLSRAIKSIQVCSQQVADSDCYRDGDLHRLMQRAKQLEARLPLQNTTVQIPYENTLGGFAMFNNGVTDLAPELTGWYGAPSVRLDAPTTLFLVGNHFSVHQTQVIAGGVAVTDKSMLSRQVMKVVIPPGVNLTEDDKAGRTYVDVHVATPYGVTPHLLIPLCKDKKPPTPGTPMTKATWDAPAKVQLAYVFSGVGITTSADPKHRPVDLTISAGEALPDRNKIKSADVTLAVTGPDGRGVLIAINGCPFVNNKFTVPAAKIHSDAIEGFKLSFGPEAIAPPYPLNAVAQLTLKDELDAEIGKVKVDNLLKLEWVKAPR